MDWPIYYKDRLHVSNLKSPNAVITLWSPYQTILPKLNPESYCVGGQLYSKRGVNFIIRNIFARPQIKNIVICGANLSGSAESLINLIEKGIDENYSIIGVEKANIDKEINREYIELLRKNIQVVNLVGEFKAEVIQLSLDKLHNLDNAQWCEPKIFPEAENKLNSKFPSEGNPFLIKADYIKDAWPQILSHIMKFGSEKGMIKIGIVKELVNVITVIREENADKSDIPDWFPFNKEDLSLYLKGFFSKETKSEDYNYGERIFSYPLGTPTENYNSPNNKKNKSFDLKGKVTLNQIEEIYLKLKRYKYDRGAVASIWNAWVDNIGVGWQADQEVKKAGNVPCMTQIQFAYRNRRLHLTAYFRSNDMFDAWPRNAFALRKLQQDLAKKLDMKVGDLVTISSLAQIYEPNFDQAEGVLKRFENKPFCIYEPRGNLIIETMGEEIIVRHTDTSGNEILEEFKINGKEPRAALRLGDILTANLCISEIAHAMDIGRELAKAELAIKNGWKYTQDKELLLS